MLTTAALTFLLLAGCAPPDAPPSGGPARPALGGPNDALLSPGVEEVTSAQAYLAEARFTDADLERGELLALACRVCHTLGGGEDHMLGPNLHGVFGRRSATVAGFDFSPALRAADIVWTPLALDAWLADPAGFLPGNNMPFAGYRSDTDRRDLIAYLLSQTSRPRD